MARLTPSSPDLAEKASETQLAAVGDVTPAFDFNGTANVAVRLSGGATGAIVLEKSFDGGTNWLPATNLGQVVTITAPATEVIFSRENGLLWRARRASGSGAGLFVRFSQ